jgi:DNA polymerase-1
MLLNYCLDERPMGRFKSHSLKNMSRCRCDAPDYDIEMGKWLKEYASAGPERRAQMRVQMHEYLALDCYYTARMYPDLVNEVVEEDPALLNHYQNVLMPASRALVEIEMHGAAVDRAFFEEQWAELNRRATPILEELREFLDMPDFNPNSPKQVAELLYDPPEKGGYGLPVLRTARRGKQQEGKTSKQVMKMLKKQFHEDEEIAWVIDQVLGYRNLIKSAGTYVKGLLERMDDDGRIRSDFLPHGTSTGRISSSNPNLQNIPESSHTKIEIRNGYVVPPGYLLGNADYSQLELRVAAWLSEDENFTAAYVEDRDFHQEVVVALFGKTKEEATPYERYMAKCCVFGVLYGRGASSLALGPEMDYVEDELGGTRWSVDDVKGFFADFFSNFPQYKAWTEEISKFGYDNQYVQTPFGNKRRFPFIPRNDNGAVARQAVNTPIQGTAALITLSAVVRIHQRFKELNEREGKHVAYVILTVHDSIMFEFLPQYIDEVREIVKYEMEENIPFKDCPVPFKSDFEAAPRWGMVKDWNLAENLPAFLDQDEAEALA